MTATLPQNPVTDSPVWAATDSRQGEHACDQNTRLEFWGLGFSHYGHPFEASLSGIKVHVLCCNSSRVRFAWSVDVPDGHFLKRPVGECRDLTEEETRALAADAGLEMAEWIDAALAACRSDVSAESLDRCAVGLPGEVEG